jgi:rsbT co-antagonist protein RsbR
MATEADSNQLREMRMRSEVFDNSPTFCVAVGPDGRTLSMNQTMLRALGYTAEEVLGKEYVPLFVAEGDQEAVGRAFVELATLRGSTMIENWVLAKDGTRRLIEWHGRFVEDSSENLDYFFGIGVDTTERRRVEAALKTSEQKLALHVRQTPLGVIEWDVDMHVLEWNPAAERIFGYSRDEALGRHGAGLIVPESALEIVSQVWRDLVQAKGGMRSTNENITKSGAIIVCDWYNTPLVSDDGSVIGVASLVDDVTEQKRMEAELRDRERAQAATIERLSAPILDLWEGILTMPVIGEVDERRAARMTESLLAAIVRSRASVTVIDLTGIERLDERVADHLLSMVRGAGLLGCRCFVCGISPESAQVMAQAGRDFSGLLAFGTLRDALGYVLRARRSSADEIPRARR